MRAGTTWRIRGASPKDPAPRCRPKDCSWSASSMETVNVVQFLPETRRARVEFLQLIRGEMIGVLRVLQKPAQRRIAFFAMQHRPFTGFAIPDLHLRRRHVS